MPKNQGTAESTPETSSTQEVRAELLKARVLNAAAELPAPTRQLLARQSLLLVLGAWLLAFAVFAYFGGIRVTGRPLLVVVGTAFGTGLFGALAGWAALARGGSTLGRGRWLFLSIALTAPFLILAWKVLWSSSFPGMLVEWPTRPGFRCLGLSLAIAACPLFAFALVRRRSDPRHPTLTGLAAGLATGSITSLLTDLWCPVGYVPHLLLGHLLPTLILGAVGAGLGRAVIALR